MAMDNYTDVLADIALLCEDNLALGGGERNRAVVEAYWRIGQLILAAEGGGAKCRSRSLRGVMPRWWPPTYCCSAERSWPPISVRSRCSLSVKMSSRVVQRGRSSEKTWNAGLSSSLTGYRESHLENGERHVDERFPCPACWHGRPAVLSVNECLQVASAPNSRRRNI